MFCDHCILQGTFSENICTVVVVLPLVNRKLNFFCVIVVEFVLALTGATMGTLIAFVFPSTMYLHIVSEKTTARLIAKVCCH